MKRPVAVAAAIIEEEGRILIGQRKEKGNCPLLWEFPGGKIEPGENPEDCLLREVKEELNLDIRLLQFYGATHYAYGEQPMALYFYRAAIVGGEMECRAHHDLRWVEKWDLGQYDFCPADVDIVRRLIIEPSEQPGAFSSQENCLWGKRRE